MTLILPSAPDPYGDGLALTAAMRFEAVTDALRLSVTPNCVARIEQHLHAALDRARAREMPVDWIRDALARCAERRTELAAEGGEARPSRSGIGDFWKDC